MLDGDVEGEGAETVTARTASATASSEREGSKKMLLAMEMTRRVIGGREGGREGLGLFLVVVVGDG